MEQKTNIDQKATPMEKFNFIRQILLFLVELYKSIRKAKNETPTDEQKKL